MAAHARRNELTRRQRLTRIDDAYQRLRVERVRHRPPERDVLLVHAADHRIGHVEIETEREGLRKDVPHVTARRVLRLQLRRRSDEAARDLAAQHDDVEVAALELEKARQVLVHDRDVDHVRSAEWSCPSCCARARRSPDLVARGKGRCTVSGIRLQHDARAAFPFLELVGPGADGADLDIRGPPPRPPRARTQGRRSACRGCSDSSLRRGAAAACSDRAPAGPRSDGRNRICPTWPPRRRPDVRRSGGR